MVTPKYIVTANKVLDLIASQPNQTWSKTQRELGEELGISQPELSLLIKLLVQAGKVRKGHPLPGVRGRNFTLEATDPSPLDEKIKKELRYKNDVVDQGNRALAPEEEVVGTVNLDTLSAEQIGAAVVRMLRLQWQKEEHLQENTVHYLTKIKDFRDQLNAERQQKIQLVNDRDRAFRERDTVLRELDTARAEMATVREQLNHVLVHAQDRQRHGSGSFQVREMLDEAEVRMLDNLMRGKPGHYRESDAEVGLAD